MRKALHIGMALLALGSMGCEIRKAMYDQPKYRPLAYSPFFGDDRASRPLIDGTVARGHLNDDLHWYTGKAGDQPVDTMPYPVTRELLVRGQERFDIFCSPCHGATGDGRGMVVRRGYKQPSSYHVDRLRLAPLGYYFDVMTNGFGVMPSYAAQVPPADRWAIAAYIRALQLSQHFDASALAAEERANLDRPAPATEPPAPAH